MRCLYLLLIFLLFGCTSVPPNSDQKLSAGQTPDLEPLPENLKSSISKKLPQFKALEAGEYIKAWWSFYDKGDIPWTVTTDINDDGKEDYAVLIHDQTHLKLLFLISQPGSYHEWLAPDFDKTFTPGQVHHGLSVVPPGQIDVAAPEIKSLILKSNGVALMDYELQNRIYYWQNGKIEVFTMSKE